MRRRGYLDTPRGQIHYCDLGPADAAAPVLLLFHQMPWCLLQYDRVQPLLADAGFRSIAFDTPGYGHSDPPDQNVTVGDIAADIAGGCRTWGVTRALAVGHHGGASLALAVCHAAPSLMAAAVLHCPPYYDAAAWTRRAVFTEAEDIIRDDGRHFADRFRFVRDRITGGLARPDSVHWSVLAFYLSRRVPPPPNPFLAYDVQDAIATLAAPTLLISNTNDNLHDAAQRIRAVRPDFAYVELPGGHSQMIFEADPGWLRAVLTFAETCR
jgi:pimeloyl-ACP methyl ester carboxylesterase